MTLFLLVPMIILSVLMLSFPLWAGLLRENKKEKQRKEEFDLFHPELAKYRKTTVLCAQCGEEVVGYQHKPNGFGAVVHEKCFDRHALMLREDALVGHEKLLRIYGDRQNQQQ